MPARQVIGQKYFQEFARRDEALDKGQTHKILRDHRVGGETYARVLRVLETNPFEPGDREFKYYARGVGLVQIKEGLDKNLKNPELVFNLVGGGGGGGGSAAAPAPVPLPAPLALMLAGVAGLAGLARLGRRRAT